LEEELKKKEFVYADGGAIGLQTCFGALMTFAPKISLSKIVNALAINARRILNIPIQEIGVGDTANLTLFDPDAEWVYNEAINKSVSKNTPFFGQTFTGKVIGVINGKNAHFNNY
ncbi:MAG: dihydroorotase, partial [Saprospiraceae bacterium]|nr:dihydroorotase [Saprospiraceae bacterium]